jgi:hypothetical protein
MSDSTRITADLPLLCAPCFEGGRLIKAVAVVGGDSVCDDHLDGHCALADLQLEALEAWAP